MSGNPFGRGPGGYRRCMAEDVDPQDGRHETADQRADRNWGEILQELRVIQTGTQLISGFLLAVAFQPRFTTLDAVDRTIYAILVALAAVSTLFGLGAVALHRGRFREHDKTAVVNVANRMLRIMLVAVALLTVGVVLFIFDAVFGRTAGVVAGTAAAAAALVLTVVVPRRRRGVGAR
jgi:high-affinity Fe2+/Pb2+ permease